jgi:hypothetical protein
MSQRPTASQSHEPWPGTGVVNVGCDGRIIDSLYTDLVHPVSTTNVWWTAQFASI